MSAVGEEGKSRCHRWCSQQPNCGEVATGRPWGLDGVSQLPSRSAKGAGDRAEGRGRGALGCGPLSPRGSRRERQRQRAAERVGLWQKALRADASSRAELKEEAGREDRVRYQGPPHSRGDGAEEVTRPGPGALTGRHWWGPWRLCRTGLLNSCTSHSGRSQRELERPWLGGAGPGVSVLGLVLTPRVTLRCAPAVLCVRTICHAPHNTGRSMSWNDPGKSPKSRS